MTRARTPKPTPPPLATTLRAALASDWRTLAALDTLTAARGSDARRLVHEALREIKATGVVLEERVGKGGVEVRLAPVPAPVPDDGACPECEEVHEADDRHDGPWEPNMPRAKRTPAEPFPALDVAAPPVGHGPPVEAPAQPQPGPSSRCAVCGVMRSAHWTHLTPAVQPPGHAFVAKRRGRPPTPSPTQAERLTAAQAVDPDVEELPTASEQGAILAGMAEQWDAAVAEHKAERAAGAEPETSRGESPPAKPRRMRLPASGPFPREQREARIEAKQSGCRPPHCHADAIHEPSRVRAFAPALCEAHRGWVEGAGGTVAPCPVCVGIEPVPLQQRCVGITHCAACGRALETLPMGALRKP